MPVFTRLRDGVFVVTVDGDYTPDEMSRAGEVPGPGSVAIWLRPG